MSAQFRRLSDIVEDIRYRFGAGGVRSRHDAPRIRQLFNTSWQELRTLVSLASDASFLRATAVLSLPTTAAIAGEVYAEVPWPVDAVSIYGIRVRTSTSGTWYPLKRVPWAAHHDYQYNQIIAPFLRRPGPVAFCARTIPVGVETVETAGAIMLFPIPTSGSYRLWYMEAWTPQLEDSDLFPGHEGWVEWAIWNTMIKMLGPDADSKKVYPMWTAERARQETLIEARARRLEDGVPVEPRDARGDGFDLEGWRGGW